MKAIVIGLVLAFLGCTQHRYFVDVDQAIVGSYDGKRTKADVDNAGASLQRQVDDAAAAAKKAEDAKETGAAEARQRADDMANRAKAQFAQFKAAAFGKLGAELRAVLDRVAADRRVVVIEQASTVAWFDPSLDVTAEVIRRLDANSSRKEMDDLRAKAAAAEKPKGKP